MCRLYVGCVGYVQMCLVLRAVCYVGYGVYVVCSVCAVYGLGVHFVTCVCVGYVASVCWCVGSLCCV